MKTDYYKSKKEPTETFIDDQIVFVQPSRFSPKVYKAKIMKVDADGHYSIKLARKPKNFSDSFIYRVPGDMIYTIKN